MSAVGAKSLMSVVMNHVDHHHLHLHHSPNRLLSIKHRSKLKLLPRHHHWTSPTSQNGEDIEWERMESLNSLNLKHLTGAAPTSAGGSAPPPSAAAGASRSVSLASVSSDGSAESHLVEQEDIVALTQEVRAFKEALGKLRRLFHPPDGKEKCGGGSGGGSAAAAVSSAHDAPLRVAAHERLGEVLRILRIILERYPALQSTELLVAAGSLIHQVKEHPYDDERNDVKEFMESIDQLALAFSSRVSEYLMGDLDSNISLASSVSSKTKVTMSCENLPSDVECAEGARVSAGAKEAAPSAPATSASEQQLNGQQMDAILLQLEQGVEVALHRAKLWSKYAKDVMSYVEKHCHLEMEYAKNVAKLAQTMKSTLKEECYLPFQSIYITAMDREIENCNLTQSTSAMLMGHKFLEPLAARRLEHERSRKQIKETWHRELKRMQEAVSNLRKAKALYVQRQQEWERAKEAAVRAENAAADNEQAKIDKRKRAEEDTLQKAMEAETVYKSCVSEANERHSQLFRVKGQVLQQIRELMLQCDQTMKAVTVSYYQLQHSVSAPAPVQFQTLCESSRLYEPGSQYMEFVRRMPLPNSKASGGREANQSLPPSSMGPMGSQAGSSSGPYSFEPYSEESATAAMLEKERKSNGSLSADSNESSGKERNLMSLPTVPIKAWGASSVGSHSNASSANAVGTQISSDTESVESSPSAKSRETSPTASPMMPARRLVPASSGDELENDQDTEVDGSYMGSYTTTRRHCMSKAAVTHTFRKLKTPSRCRECDSYVYFQGAECIECGLGCHKKCLESLTIQCGHKRLPRKMTTFGVDLSQHLTETGATVPHLLVKCIHEIDSRGIQIKGLYRVSGVKSKVEKLCQAFENGADLVDLTDIHPNVIANVLKLYLRQLPEPLLTSKLYPEFIRIAKECSELCPGSSTAPSTTPSATSSGASTSGPAACGPVPASVVDELRDLVHRLPRHHYSTLSFLMHHLKGVAMEAECNNMPSSNLGIVFGPTLLRTAEGSASLSSLVDTVHQTKVIELLIMNADDIFGAPSAAAHHHHQHQHHHHQPSVKEHPAKRSDEGSLLSKVPVVRSISFLDKHRKSRSDTETILSTPADRRAAACGGADPREEVTLPGFVAEQRKSGSLDIDHLSEESLGLGLTEDDGDEESDLPDFLLPDDSSGKTRKPLPYFRTGTAPKIFKASLKDYHGLEGVDLNLLSSQDQEVHHHHHHPQAHPQQRESVTSVASQPGGMGAESAAQPATAAAAAKASLLGPGHGHTPLMDSSIDSDHSWESVSTGSSGRGTQHSDQGSLGSAINATTTSSTTIQQQQQQRLGGVQDRDEIDGGRLDSVTLNSLTSLTARASINDENRVKIQVPSGAPLPRTSIGSSSSSSSSASSGGSSSSSPVSSSAGVVTVLEGPVSLSTVVESFSSADDKASGSWSSSSPSAAAACGASNRSVASESAATAHDVTHVFSSRSASSGAEPSAESTTSQRTKSGERVARFV